MVNEVKYREIERFLTDAGWTVIRQTGSHIQWKGPNGKGRLQIPPHGGVVSKGVVRQIIKAIPDAPEEWR